MEQLNNQARIARDRNSLQSQLHAIFMNPHAFFAGLMGAGYSHDDDNSDFYSSDDDDHTPIFAGQAHRHANAAVVDLVSSPQLHVPGVVNLDSDDEHDRRMRALQSQSPALNRSLDSDNYEMSIKIKWGIEVQKFAHRRYQKFADLIATIAQRENVEPRDIVLDLEDKLIAPDDTPHSIGYRLSKFINGRVVKRAEGMTPKAVAKPKRDANTVNLKIQLAAKKKNMTIAVGKDEKMKILLYKISEELKCSAKAITLEFDGDRVDPESTPAELELENDYVIDCILAAE
jgi:hypothetical protein